MLNEFGGQDDVFDDEVDKGNAEENTDIEENTDEKTDLEEDDLYPDLSLTDNARPPKIWISKTASMEHDLD